MKTKQGCANDAEMDENRCLKATQHLYKSTNMELQKTKVVSQAQVAFVITSVDLSFFF